MPRFTAKPVVVEAHQFRGGIAELPEAFRLAVVRHRPDGRGEVRVNGGVAPCRAGDWIVRGPDGGFSVMPDAAFEAAYAECQPVLEVVERVKRAYNRKELSYG